MNMFLSVKLRFFFKIFFFHFLQALKDQAKLFKDANVPVYGIGVQSHIHNAHLDITSIKVKYENS